MQTEAHYKKRSTTSFKVFRLKINITLLFKEFFIYFFLNLHVCLTSTLYASLNGAQTNKNKEIENIKETRGLINWAACGEPILRNGFHLFLGVKGGGGEAYFWEVIVGVHCRLI